MVAPFMHDLTHVSKRGYTAPVQVEQCGALQRLSKLSVYGVSAVSWVPSLHSTWIPTLLTVPPESSDTPSAVACNLLGKGMQSRLFAG